MRVVVWIFALTVCFGIPSSSHAQNPFAVKRIVDTSIITNYDISQRVRLLRAFGFRGPDPEALALSQLTEDKLKIAAAERNGIGLSEDGYEIGFADFAEQRGASPGGLLARMRNSGVSDEAFRDFMTAGLLWRGVVQSRFRARAQPSETDVQNALNFGASGVQESVLIREIAIPFAERGQDGARRLAERIARDVGNGSSFAAFARQYSRTPTAARGGLLGWRPANQLPPVIASAVLALSPGEVSAPIEVPAGIILLQLADIREEDATTSTDILASYVRIDVPSSDAANAAEALRDEAETCIEADGVATEAGGASGRYGPDLIADIPVDIAMVLAGLDASEVGATAPNENGVSVIMLCNRTVTTDPEQIEALQNQIFSQRMAAYANGYLQELLSDAVIIDK